MTIEKIRGYDFGGPVVPSIPTEPGYLPDGWYSDHPYLREAVSETNARIIFDVGSFSGGSAARFATYAGEISAGADFAVISIDTWLGSTEHYDESGLIKEFQNGQILTNFMENMARAGVSEHVIAFPQTSSTAAKVLRKLGVAADLIYLDASHEYEDVMHDLENYWPLVRPGGILFGDDFEAPWDGVITAANEFATRYSLPIEAKIAPASGIGMIRPDQRKFVFRKPA